MVGISTSCLLFLYISSNVTTRPMTWSASDQKETGFPPLYILLPVFGFFFWTFASSNKVKKKMPVLPWTSFFLISGIAFCVTNPFDDDGDDGAPQLCTVDDRALYKTSAPLFVLDKIIPLFLYSQCLIQSFSGHFISVSFLFSLPQFQLRFDLELTLRRPSNGFIRVFYMFFEKEI